MTAVLNIRSVGSSAGVILPKDLLDHLKLEIGDELAVKKSKDSLELSPYDANFARRVRVFERSH